MITRLARWWLNRRSPVIPDQRHPIPTGECICGRRVAGADWHLVVALPDDDAALGIEGGGTAMSADFCDEHCPGGCRQGCPTMVR